MAATSEELTVLATIRDEMTAGLAKIGTEVDALSRKIDAQRTKVTAHGKATAGYSKNLNALSKTFGNFGKLGGPLSGALTSTSGALDKLSKTKAVGVLSALATSAGTFGEKIDLHDKLSTLSSDLESGVVQVAKLTAGFALASAGIAAFGLRSVASLQQTQLGLQTLTGSTQAGNSLFNQLKSMTGVFSTSTLATSAESMLNQDTPASIVGSRLSALENIAAVQANPSEALQNLISGINSIQHTGRITSQGLDSLAAAGIPGYAVLSQDTGKSKLQVAQMVDQNRYSAQAFLNQIDSLSGPILSKFKGGLQKDSQTIGGMFDTLKNKITLSLTNAATPLAKTLQGDMPELSRLVTTMVNTMAPFGVKLLGSIVTPLAKDLPSALQKLQPMLPSLEASFSKLVTAVLNLLPGLVQLASDFAPVLPTMVNFATDLAKLLDPMLKLLNSNPLLRDSFAALLLSLLAFNKLSAVAGTIRAFASGIGVLAEKLGLLSKAESAEAKSRAAEDIVDDVNGGGKSLIPALTKAGLLVGGTYVASKAGASYEKSHPQSGLTKATQIVNKAVPQSNPNTQANELLHPSIIYRKAISDFHAIFGGGGASKKPSSTPTGSTSGGPSTVAVSSGGGSPVTQHITIHAANMTPQELSTAIAKANRDAYRRAGNSKTTAATTMHTVGNTGSKGS